MTFLKKYKVAIIIVVLLLFASFLLGKALGSRGGVKSLKHKIKHQNEVIDSLAVVAQKLNKENFRLGMNITQQKIKTASLENTLSEKEKDLKKIKKDYEKTVANLNNLSINEHVELLTKLLSEKDSN